MLLTLLVLSLVLVVLAAPTAAAAFGRWRAERRARRSVARPSREPFDPGRERRAEQRARQLLRSCVEPHEWEMYRDLGFIHVVGRRGSASLTGRESSYAYIIYPHKPIVAYVPETGRLLNEYCVEFPDLSDSVAGPRLPASDDVLAKWMALTGDEERLLRSSNMHLPGRQVDPARIRRDLWRLSEWERRNGTESAARSQP